MENSEATLDHVTTKPLRQNIRKGMDTACNLISSSLKRSKNPVLIETVSFRDKKTNTIKKFTRSEWESYIRYFEIKKEKKFNENRSKFSPQNVKRTTLISSRFTFIDEDDSESDSSTPIVSGPILGDTPTQITHKDGSN